MHDNEGRVMRKRLVLLAAVAVAVLAAAFVAAGAHVAAGPAFHRVAAGPGVVVPGSGDDNSAEGFWDGHSIRAVRAW